MQIIRDFTGFLNYDTSPWRTPAKDYLDALNITKDTQGDYTDGPISNIVGNQEVVNVGLHAGNNTCIGAYADRLRNRVIYFDYNNLGYHSINSFSVDTGVITKIFESKTDSAGIDILNLQLLYKVNDINVIHRDEDGDLLLWNDGYNRPGQLNIDDFIAGLYTPVSDDLIRLDRQPPIDEPTSKYTSDLTNLVNNFKKKLFQFAYCYRYANGEKSTLSPISKIPIAVDAYSVDVDSAPNQNNQIIISVVGGPKDYKSIIIYGRELSAGNIFSDWFKIDELDKTDYNIPSGGSYEYTFLNDGQYVTEDVRYTDLAFVRSADKCNAQTIVNGNVIVQAGITDGYDAIQRSDVNVQLVSVLKDTQGNSAAPANPSITVFQGIAGNSYYVTFTIGTDVGEGSIYKIKFRAPVYAGADFNVDVTYTALAGDTALDVANGLLALITPQLGPTSFGSVLAPNKVSVNSLDNRPEAYPYDQIVISAVPLLLKSGGSPTWKWNEKIRLGIVYKGKYGKSNGVVSFVSSADDPTDFSVTTNDFAFNNDPLSPYYGNPQVPAINMSISSLPPSWAESFTIVRTINQSVSTFLQYITCEVKSADVNFYYFCIQNLTTFREQNTGFVPSYVFQSGDRMRVYAEVIDAAPYYSIPATVADFEILGTVTQQMTGGTNDGLYIKVKKPTAAVTYGPRMMIEIYRPSLRSSDETQVFYTFGETYPIYTGAGGIRYHVGENQNQTASQPATFTFEDGDVYYKFRDFYPLAVDGTIDTINPYSRGIMDANYSDYFNSAVNSNGTPWVIESNAKRLYRPIEQRFSQAFQPGTNLNGINIFYPEDFIEVIRDYGDIMRIFPWNNGLVTCQQFKIGVVPVLQQMTFNTDGSSNLILSSNLLNRIQYYKGEYGIGTVPESLAWNNNSIYGWDNKRGVIWRISQNGLEPISIVHNMNNFAVTHSAVRGFDFKIYGVFDTYNNQYISALERADNIPIAYKTLVWTEASSTDRSGFSSFVSYDPEYMVSLNNLLITFKMGKLYTHDNEEDYNTFYGFSYESYVTASLNDSPLMKKTFQNLTLLSDDIWFVTEMTTNIKSFPGQAAKQLTDIKPDEFIEQEGEWSAAIRGATNSGKGPFSGGNMKGQYAIMKFQKNYNQKFFYLNAVAVGIADSPKTPR